MRENGLVLYERSDSQDVALLRWWMGIRENGELETTFTPQVRDLSSFLSLFQKPNVLLYSCNEKGDVWFATWFENFLGDTATFMGMWVAKEKRSTKEVVKLTRKVYKYAFNVWPTVFSVTKQSDLLTTQQRLGYKVLGNFPRFWGGEDSAWLLALTLEAFDGGDLGRNYEDSQQSSN